MKPRKTIPRKPKENHVGRPKKIETPEDLLNLFYEFVEITKKKEIVKTVRFTNSDGGVSTKEEVFPQPFFLLDFTDYLGVDCRYLEKIKLRNDEFFTVVSYIKEFIANQKMTGAMVGMYNASIVSQHLGLVNKQDLTTNGDSFNKVNIVFDKPIPTYNGDEGNDSGEQVD